MVEPGKNADMDRIKHQKKIAEEANKACNLPGNKNGPNLDKGGERGKSGMSDFA